jgi:hypothetical protein
MVGGFIVTGAKKVIVHARPHSTPVDNVIAARASTNVPGLLSLPFLAFILRKF